jgi:probable rRNA maturation factor
MTPEAGTLEIQLNATGDWSLPDRILVAGCRAVLESEGITAGQVSVTLVSDNEICQLNREFFQKDRPTDVMAFSLQDPGDPVLGDVYVGFEQARRQALELGIPLEEELVRLVIHGTLHLAGHDHPEGEERFESPMFRVQEEILARVRSAPPA